MATVVIPAYDTSGAPLTGLTPSWHALFNAETESPYTPQPAFAEIGGGLYKFNQPTGIDITGIIDFGATASPRYMVLTAERFVTFAAFDATTTPLAGLTIVWDVIEDVEGNAFTPQPTRIPLGLGVYKIASHSGRAVGVLDMTAAATPRYAFYDSDEAEAVAEAVTPDGPVELSSLAVGESDLPIDLQIGINDELVVSGGDMVLTTGTAAIAQRCHLALAAFTNEWFRNLESGVPWYEDILGQKRDDEQIRVVIRNTLLSVDGVLNVTKLQISWDGATRDLGIQWEILTDAGQSASGTTTVI